MTEKLAIDGGTPVRDSFLVFGRPNLGDDELREISDSIRSGWVGTGPKVQRFEAAFADYIGARHAIAVSSCTAALHLAMLTSGIEAGDEVITTPMTFAASANAIIHAGGRPVFVDVDRDTMNIAPDQIAEAITDRTRAIMPVHFAGRPCSMDAIISIARAHELFVIDDAAHCIEGAYKGKKVGVIADATCFSFYVTKNITTVEGGMVTTDDEDRAARIKTLALHGMTKDAWRRFSDEGFKHYEVVAPGFKYNLTDIAAGIGLQQLPHVDRWLRLREQVWERYDEAFRDLPLEVPAAAEPETVHARHLYTILLDLEQLRVDRDRVLEALQAENIGCGIHYRSLHLHPFYQAAYGLQPQHLPNSAWISDRTISLPLSPGLTERDVDDVIRAVTKVLTVYGS